jgi:hypothetical protein
MFGNDVHAANTAILFRSSTEAARDDFFKALGQAAPDKAVKELIEKTKGTPAALGAIRDALGADTFDRVAKDTLDGMEDYFETSALSAYISRGLSHNKILAEKDFMDNVLASFGEQVNERGIRTAIDNGEDVIIPKSSLKIYGLNIGEYIRDKKTAKSMAQKVKQANTELGDWEKMLKDVDARISSAWSTGGKQGGDDVAALVKEKMDIMTEIDNAKAAADAAIDSQTFEELPKDLVSLIARIADSEGDDLVRLSDKDADVVMKYAGKFFPIEAYKMPGGAIDFMNTSLGNQKKAGFEALTRVIDRIHQMWKPTVTGLQPAFHIRNAVGSTALNMLDIGFKTADPRINAIASKAARGLDEVVEVGGHKIKASEISNLMVANNAFATGQVTDIDALSKSYMSGITDIAAPQKAGVGKVWKTATDAGMKVTDTVESQVRGVNFIAHLEDALEKGVSLKEAAAYAGSMVQKYHFDYTDLTDIERQVFKRIMPFYTFTRKNLPLQLEELLNKPRVAAYLDTWNDNMEQSYGVDSANMPNWMQSQMALAMPFLNAGDGRTAYANISLPMADVTSLGSPKEAMNKALGMITPIAKAPLELSMNRTMLSGAPIWRNEGEKNAEILKYILSQNGLLRSAQSFVDNVNPEDPLAERPLENITQIPGIGKLIRGYNEEAGQEQAMYEYNRQLGNEVQYLKSRGVNVPDTNTAELLGYLDAAVTEQFKRTGQLTDTQKIRAQGRRSTANNALPKMPTYDPQAMMEKLKRSIY